VCPPHTCWRPRAPLRPPGNILLIDEIHTPDSSRYWLAGSYEQRHAAGQEPQNIDKEFLRLWFRANCDPYNDEVRREAGGRWAGQAGGVALVFAAS
jgi:phosphoribosylaminoimidazole-succinocarboxamide synthase